MLRQWWQRCARTRRQRPQCSAGLAGQRVPRPGAFRPRLEALEDRTVPSVITVTNTLDGSPPPTGSLRWAIGQAHPGDTIKFVLASTSNTITLTAGPLDLTQKLSIQGPGQAVLTVDGAKHFTVFMVNAPGAFVNISGLTIADGLASSAAVGDGGGIANHAGILTVSSCAVTDNSAALGGGLSNFGQGATSNILQSTFTGNSASLDGGAIYNNSGKLSVQNSSLFDNTALNGGAIYTDGGLANVLFGMLMGNTAGDLGGGLANASGTDNVSFSTLSGNTAATRPPGLLNQGGGGIANLSGKLAVNHDMLFGNSTGGLIVTSGGDGGGILNAGSLSVSYSTFSLNTALLGGGGGIANEAGGSLMVTQSTLSGNRADLGGGIVNFSTKTAFVSYTTLAGNNAGASGGAGVSNRGSMILFADCLSGNMSASTGGGAANVGGTLKITNTTIANNVAMGGGGGIFNALIPVTTAGVFVSNSTIAGNTAAQGGGIDNLAHLATCDTIDANNVAALGPDILGNFGSFGFNLVGNTVGGSGFLPTDLLNVNPRLGLLANNGGPTQTMALLAGSPAINAGLNVPPPIFFPPGPFDQRGPGFARIVFGRIDIGAYEAQFLPPGS